MAGSLIGGAIAGVGSLISGSKQNKNVQKGIDAQTEAARMAIEAQRQGFVDTTMLQQGRAQSGDAATARMLQILGLPVPQSLTSGAAYESIYGGGNGLTGGGGGMSAAQLFEQRPDIAKAYQNLTDADRKYLKQQGYDGSAQGYASYWQDTYGALPKAQGGLGTGSGSGAGGAGGGGQYALDVPDPGVNGLTQMIQATPGYQFRMQEGINALDSSAASRGMLLSGSQLRRLQDFGSEYAAQEFDKYWNRLAGVAGAGQTATGDISGAAQQSAGSQAGIQNQLGQNLASSYGQRTSTFGNALGVIGGAAQQAFAPQPTYNIFGG